MKEKKKTIVVKDRDTLLNVLKNEFKDLSIKTIKNYIKHKMVIVNNKVVTNSSTKVDIDSSIIIYFTKREIPNYVIKILYEDEDLIVIDKPSGLLSISNKKEKELTAFHLVSDYLKTNNINSKLFVVHRLDQYTSGVLLFSKNIKLKEELQSNWNKIVKLREYYCVVEGKTPKKEKIETYLTMNHFQKVYSTKNTEIGHLAITRYETIKYKKPYSLLKVEIDTGRRNQIRVHLSEKGFPIVGDKKYDSNINPIGRLALHASKLYLIDPRTNAILKLESKIPKEIISLVD